jgi:hypothetical protein
MDGDNVRIEFKPLPAHWSYLLSRKATKQIFIELDVDCRLVEYMGTGRKPSKLTAGLHSAGDFDARRISTGWCFRLQLWGISDQIIAGCQAEFGIIIADDIRAFILKRKTDVVDSTVFPVKRQFFFRVQEGTLTPSFSTVKIEGLDEIWANRSPWWS